jgi:hypothetical protein
MVAKRFFYVCAGILCLALAYHLGVQSATAQVGSTVNGFAMYPGGGAASTCWVMTPSGDIYGRYLDPNSSGSSSPLYFVGNFWGGPTPATQQTWGGVKARYRQGAPAAPSDK